VRTAAEILKSVQLCASAVQLPVCKATCPNTAVKTGGECLAEEIKLFLAKETEEEKS